MLPWLARPEYSRAVPECRAQLKHRHPALANGMEAGNLELVETGNPKIFAFRRRKGSDQVRVIVNQAGRPATLSLQGTRPVSLPAWGWRID